MDAKDQLLRLLRIQELAIDIRGAEQILDQAPGKIEEIENRFRERNAEYVAIKERHDELEEDQRNRSAELKELEENREKFMADLMQVKNQREYAAMLKEIDSVKAQISDHEMAIIKDMEEIEKLKAEMQTNEEHIKAEREAVDKERSVVEAQAEKARAEIDEKRAQRAAVEAELPGSVARTLHKLETTRHGIFLAKAENGTCLSCFVRIRPQVFQEIKQAIAVHTCESCRRFLHFEPALKEAAQPAEDQSREDMGAVDGGAV